MLTKTLRFDEDVLDIIRAMDWRDSGRLGVITGGQLERKLYERTNKALETMGGKWNRKAGGHVFNTDPRPMVEGLLENGALTVTRDGFFETPRAVVERMLALVPTSGDLEAYYLEPSAGKGAIADILVEYGVERDKIACVEKNEQRMTVLTSKGYPVDHADFLSFYDTGFARVYMNPPFEAGQDIDHVCHAYDLLDPGGILVSVMSESPFFASTRKAAEFREWLAEMGGYSEQLPAGSFKESGTGVNARLVVIEK
jgi:xanthine/CO dehydrogenase XdhC/CoxF family maturation factor